MFLSGIVLVVAVGLMLAINRGGRVEIGARINRLLSVKIAAEGFAGKEAKPSASKP